MRGPVRPGRAVPRLKLCWQLASRRNGVRPRRLKSAVSPRALRGHLLIAHGRNLGQIRVQDFPESLQSPQPGKDPFHLLPRVALGATGRILIPEAVLGHRNRIVEHSFNGRLYRPLAVLAGLNVIRDNILQPIVVPYGEVRVRLYPIAGPSVLKLFELRLSAGYGRVSRPELRLPARDRLVRRLPDGAQSCPLVRERRGVGIDSMHQLSNVNCIAFYSHGLRSIHPHLPHAPVLQPLSRSASMLNVLHGRYRT